jgi:hypothetical protein
MHLQGLFKTNTNETSSSDKKNFHNFSNLQINSHNCKINSYWDFQGLRTLFYIIAS